MRYLIVDTESQALSITRQEAQDRGCTGVTSRWYAYRETADGRWCLMVNDGAATVQGHHTTDQEPEWPAPDPI
ncbi:MAG TPA: hypothetical protein VK973_05945 [Arenicellales bacterium]|nr:hypothetical protein [Arenicellales bacterium]